MQEEHTRREDKTQLQPEATKVETQPQAGGVPIHLTEFRGYKVIKEFPATGGEADTYLIEKNGKVLFLKLYRSGVVPKESVLRKTIELSRKMPEHVVLIFGYGFEQRINRWFEVQEYAEFGSLLDFVRSRNLYSNTDFAREVVKELSECIHALHTQGIIHRDLKPSNVLVRDEHPLDLVLTDFGISSLLEEDVSKIFSTVKGTYAYFAPESFSGYFGKEVDWWALGIITLELLTGKNPLSGLAPQVIMHTLSTKGVEVPKELKKEWKLLLKGLLTKDPQKRWGYEEIQKWLKGEKDIPVYHQEELPKAPAEEWKRYGFTAKGAEKWKKVIDDPKIARDFKEEGFTPEESKLWISAGLVNVSSIKSWINAGYNKPNVVRIYEDHGVGPAIARKLDNAGIDYKTFLYIYEHFRIQPKELLSIASWVRNKNEVERSNVPVVVFVSYYKELAKYTNNFDKIYQIIRLGIKAEDVVKSLEVVIDRIKDKYDVSFEKLLNAVTYTLKYNSTHIDQQISVDDFVEYFLNIESKGINNYEEALELYISNKEVANDNISLEEFLKWHNLMVKKYKLNSKTLPAVIRLCKAKGISVDEFEKWLELAEYRWNYIELIDFIEQCINLDIELSQVKEYISRNRNSMDSLNKALADIIKYNEMKNEINKVIDFKLYGNINSYSISSSVIYATMYLILDTTSIQNFIKQAFFGLIILFFVLTGYYIVFNLITIRVIGRLAYYILGPGIFVRIFTTITMLSSITFLNLILSAVLGVQSENAGVLFFLVSTGFLLIFLTFTLVRKK
ncbi:MAG: protein kinase [Aquificaceae bacterium]